MMRRHQGRVVSTSNPISCSSACKSSFRDRRNGPSTRNSAAASELRGLVCVTIGFDRDFAGTPIDRNPLIGVDEHISELIAEPPMADAEIIREAERPRIAQRCTQEVTENFRRARKEVRKLGGLGVVAKHWLRSLRWPLGSAPALRSSQNDQSPGRSATSAGRR
jgi:hypothetical protein